MKINSCYSFYLLLLPCLLLSMAVRSQSLPSTDNSLPAFHLQLIDSSFYVSNQPNARKFIAIIYFSPDCGHCIEMTEALVQKADSLSSTLVLMAANKPLQELQQFSDQFRPKLRLDRRLCDVELEQPRAIPSLKPTQPRHNCGHTKRGASQNARFADLSANDDVESPILRGSKQVQGADKAAML